MTKPLEAPTLPFTERTYDGTHVVCLVCRERDGSHAPTCPIVALDGHVRELAAHVGEFVANVTETLEAIGRVLRDERQPPAIN